MPGLYDDVLELARRRGFFWPAYETYGGAAGLYVLGNLGVKLADKIVRQWRELFIRRNSFVEVDTPNLTPQPVLEASGHVSNFRDPMAECMNCHRKYRADHLLQEAGIKLPLQLTTQGLKEKLEGLKCPGCGKISGWEVKPFLTMFETRLGPYNDVIGYLRPETAQGIFVEFRRIFETEREKLPLGVGQVGRGFRNEISPRQGIIRLREFRMLELEVFLDPHDMRCQMLSSYKQREVMITKVEDDKEENLRVKIGDAVNDGIISNEWMAYMLVCAEEFIQRIGVPAERIRFREVPGGERAHYSSQTFDVEVNIEGIGWLEVAGIAYRTDFDLKAHMKKTGADYSVALPLDSPRKEMQKRWGIMVERLKERYPERWKDVMKEYSKIKERTGEPPKEIAGVKIDDLLFIKEEIVEVTHRKFIPHVVEPSFGLERLMLAALCHAYRQKDDRVVLSLPSFISPVSVCVFPLVSKEDMIDVAKKIEERLRNAGFDTFYDESGSIGRRYARADEIGTPLCITVDGETLFDSTVTFRDRDTWKQYRVDTSRLEEEVARVVYKIML